MINISGNTCPILLSALPPWKGGRGRRIGKEEEGKGEEMGKGEAKRKGERAEKKKIWVKKRGKDQKVNTPIQGKVQNYYF